MAAENVQHHLYKYMHSPGYSYHYPDLLGASHAISLPPHVPSCLWQFVPSIHYCHSLPSLHITVFPNIDKTQ